MPSGRTMILELRPAVIEGGAVMILFEKKDDVAPVCPHCKKDIISTDSGWKKTVSKLNGQSINGVKIGFIEVNGFVEEDNC